VKEGEGEGWREFETKEKTILEWGVVKTDRPKPEKLVNL